MQPKVSIVMPIYNAASFLEKGLNKIAEQTYPNIELIIIDDGSTDNSLEIAKRFESDKIKLLSVPNGGAAIARNKGLEIATGDYIQFMDIDDYIDPEKIEKQVFALREHPRKVAVCNYINFFRDEELKHPKIADQRAFIYSTDDPARFLLNLWGANGQSNFIQTNCWLTPRSVINKSGYWRAYRCPDDDGEFFTRVLLSSNGIIYTPGVYNYYRREFSGNKLSTSSQRKYLQNVLLTIDLKFSYLKNRSPEDELNRAFARQYLNFAVYHYPAHRILTSIALRRYKSFGIQVKPPRLGNAVVEMFKTLFGWKFVRLVIYYFKRR